MILREIGFNDKNVTSFLGSVNELSYIGISQTFDSDITRIYDKKMMNDIYAILLKPITAFPRRPILSATAQTHHKTS